LGTQKRKTKKKETRYGSKCQKKEEAIPRCPLSHCSIRATGFLGAHVVQKLGRREERKKERKENRRTEGEGEREQKKKTKTRKREDDAGRVGSECIIPYRGDGLNTRHSLKKKKTTTFFFLC